MIAAGAGAGILLLAGCQSAPRRVEAAPAPAPRNDPPPPRPTRPTYAGSQNLDSLPSGVIPRREWAGAATIASRANPMVRVERITVHHDAINSGSLRTKAEVARRIEAIRKNHVGMEWADIGYHYVVDPMGNVWEGRPLRYQGAHVKPANERNMGIVLMGNFEEQKPTSAATTALYAFLESQLQRFNVPVRSAGKSRGLYTHRELSPTLCPGRNLQSQMIAARDSRGALARA